MSWSRGSCYYLLAVLLLLAPFVVWVYGSIRVTQLGLDTNKLTGMTSTVGGFGPGGCRPADAGHEYSRACGVAAAANWLVPEASAWPQYRCAPLPGLQHCVHAQHARPLCTLPSICPPTCPPTLPQELRYALVGVAWALTGLLGTALVLRLCDTPGSIRQDDLDRMEAAKEARKDARGLPFMANRFMLDDGRVVDRQTFAKLIYEERLAE